jgi:hypothetical protein
MARVPLITSPCPLHWRGSPVPGMDFCGHCQRRVHNLDLMSTQQREAFLSGCSGNVCVSYTVRRTARIPLAMGLGFAVLAGAAIAGDLPPMPDNSYSNVADIDQMTAGGTEAGEKLQWIDPAEASLPNKPDLPDIDAATWLPTPKTGETST